MASVPEDQSSMNGESYFQDNNSKTPGAVRFDTYPFGANRGESSGSLASGTPNDEFKFGGYGINGGYGDSKSYTSPDFLTPTPLPYATERLSSISTTSDSSPPPPNEPPKKARFQPTFSLLFSLSPPLSNLSIVGPAVFFSVVAGAIPPYMTELIGSAFQGFSDYTITTYSPTLTPAQLATAKLVLLESVKMSAIKFSALGFGTFIISGLSFAFWTINGERTAKALRLEVFNGIGGRSMAWYDLGMGMNEENEEEMAAEGSSGQGAGGLMGRFAK